MFQNGCQKLSRIIILYLCNLFRRPCEDNLSSATSTLPAEVNYIVSNLDHIHIMLYYHHRISPLNQPLKHLEQNLHIIKMKPGGGFIKDIQCATGITS